ncbi:hypothetical protein [Mesorhizobium sp.]|nr:hypothetical protein [Mesorhizobium sp.]
MTSTIGFGMRAKAVALSSALAGFAMKLSGQQKRWPADLSDFIRLPAG